MLFNAKSLFYIYIYYKISYLILYIIFFNHPECIFPHSKMASLISIVILSSADSCRNIHIYIYIYIYWIHTDAMIKTQE